MSSYISALIASIAFLPQAPRPWMHWHHEPHYLHLARANVSVPFVFIPYEGAQCTVLFCHGNAESVVNTQRNAEKFSADIGCNVAMVEYPGYYGTKGQQNFAPSEMAACEAAEAALNRLIGDMGIDARELIVHGHSLGSGVATHLAQYCAQNNVPLGGLLLQSPIASAFRVILPRLCCTLPFDIFVNVDKIDAIRCRLAIVHGTADGVVPISNAELLVQRATTLALPPLYIEGAGHNDIDVLYREQWIAFVRQFVALVLRD